FRTKGNEVSANDPSGALWCAQTTVLPGGGDREGAGAQWASGGSGGHVQSANLAGHVRPEEGAHYVLGFEGRKVLRTRGQVAGPASASRSCAGGVSLFSLTTQSRFLPFDCAQGRNDNLWRLE